MFGALRQNQKHEPLTFVENPNIASALSRNRRDKPLVSCELCRTRKVRCNGQSSGCSKCIAVGAVCKYPSKEDRRKKSSVGGKVGGPGMGSSSSSEGQQQREDDSYDSAQGDGVQDGMLELGPDSAPQTADEGSEMFDFDAEMDHDQRYAKEWLFYNEHGDGSCENWMSLDGFMDSNLSIPREVMEDTNMVNCDTSLSHYSGKSESASGRHDRHSNRSDASPEGQNQSMTAPSYGVTQSNFSKSPSAGFPNNLRLDMSSQMSPFEYWAPPSTPSSAKSASSRGRHSAHDNKQALGHKLKDANKSDECNCLRLTACLLEELGAKSASNNPSSIDVQLSYFRETIVSCSGILDCERCNLASENNMLLAMSGQYMTTICEKLVACYVQMHHAQAQQQRRSKSSLLYSPSGHDKSDWPTSGGDDMWFSTYRIGSNYERMQVLRCIITIQIGEFWRLLGKFRTREGIGRGHLLLLSEATERTKSARAMLKDSVDLATAGVGPKA